MRRTTKPSRAGAPQSSEERKRHMRRRSHRCVTLVAFAVSILLLVVVLQLIIASDKREKNLESAFGTERIIKKSTAQFQMTKSPEAAGGGDGGIGTDAEEEGGGEEIVTRTPLDERVVDALSDAMIFQHHIMKDSGFVLSGDAVEILESHAPEMQERGRSLTSTVSDASLNGFGPFTELNATCHYVYPLNRDILRFELRRRRGAKKHQLSELGLHYAIAVDMLKGWSNTSVAAIHYAGPPTPPMVNPMPIVLDAQFDVTVPFGKWRAFFNPPQRIRDDVAAVLHARHLNKNDSNNNENSINNTSAGAVVTDIQTSDATLPLHMTGDLYNHLVAVEKTWSTMQLANWEPPLYTAVLRDAVVSHGHVVTCEKAVLTAGGCVWDFYLPKIHALSDMMQADVAVPLCDKWCAGYYHFTHEHLPRLALVYDTLKQNPNAKIVIAQGTNGFINQYLMEVLGFSKSQIVKDVPVLARRVLYPAPQKCGNAYTHMLHMLRAIVFSRLRLASGTAVVTSSASHIIDTDRSESRPVDSPSQSPRKLRLLFAERADFSRMPVNYNAVKRRLMEEYETTFDFVNSKSARTVRDQIAAFHNADLVIGTHGANIANVMWMRRGAHLVEMMSYRDGNLCYYTTASRVGVRYHLLLHGGEKATKFFLEYDRLKAHVDHSIAELKKW